MSQTYVLTRDGRKVLLDPTKIVNAVIQAFNAVDGEVTDYAKEKAEKISAYITSKMEEDGRDYNVEEIQNLVEHGLMSSKRKDVAKAYMLYRETRSRERNRNRTLTKTISEKLNATNVQGQNANVDERSFGGRIGEATSAMMRQYALDYCLSDMARNNHLNNEIYIHDLDHYPVGDHNCLTVPFDDLLAKGFSLRQTDIRPASSVNTACQLIAVIFQVQSLCQFGLTI